MKYGNFITKGYLKFTDSEIENIKNRLIDIFSNGFLNLKFKEITYCSYGNGINFLFECPIWVGRSAKMSRIKFRGIGFQFYKSTGCLEIYKDPLLGWSKENVYYDYDNAPTFQYACHIAPFGTEIRYHCQNVENIGMNKCYTYGENLDDMRSDFVVINNLIHSFICYAPQKW